MSSNHLSSPERRESYDPPSSYLNNSNGSIFLSQSKSHENGSKEGGGGEEVGDTVKGREMGSLPTSRSSKESFALLSHGRPFQSPSTEDRRDFTIKATRQDVPPPPPVFSPEPLLTSNLVRSRTTPSISSSPTKYRQTHHRHSSSSTSIHAFIPDPQYPARSQPVNLHRSPSFTDGENIPSISGGMRRKWSISDNESNDDEAANERKELNRPLHHRSDSLPVFPPPEVLSPKKQRSHGLSELPSNPKSWLPSHLSLYISHTLSFHPLIEADITSFIRASHLSGRTFLRLQDHDMEEMGINSRWRPLLSDAREKLRREVLGGKIWGFEGPRYGDEDTEKGISIKEEDEKLEEERKEDWKMSWRKIEGKKSRGRVRGMAQAIEASPMASPTSPIFQSEFSSLTRPRFHTRNMSTSSSTSTASIDSGSGIEREYDMGTSPELPTLSTLLPEEKYQSNILSHEGVKPYGLVRRPSQRTKAGGRTSRDGTENVDPSTILFQSEERQDGSTVKSNQASPRRRASSGRSGLAGLFGLEVPSITTITAGCKVDSDLGDDLLSMKLGDGKGSMIIVKKSQLDDLQRRLEEVESQLATVLAASRPTSPTSPSCTVSPTATTNSTTLGSRVLSHLAAAGNLGGEEREKKEDQGREIMGWTALGGYCIAASIGIGIVAGEVVVSKLFGLGRR